MREVVCRGRIPRGHRRPRTSFRLRGCRAFRSCVLEERILVTLDLDFANVRAYPPGSHAGIVVLRSRSQDKRTLLSHLSRILAVLVERSPANQLWIVERNRIRVRES